MEHRRLGRSDLSLSVVSYGNWLTHGDGVGNAAAAACVRIALEAGITVFDTADMYADGRADELLGSAIAGIRRESVIARSKVGLPMSMSLTPENWIWFWPVFRDGIASPRLPGPGPRVMRGYIRRA